MVSTAGVKSVSLFTSPQAHGTFARTVMFDDGAHRDGSAGDGIYGASFVAGGAFQETRFYLRGNGNNSAVTLSPRRAEYEFYAVRAIPSTRTNPVRITSVNRSS